MSFLELCLNGEARNCDVDTFIAQWHSGLAGTGLELHEHLGFTWEEYQVWVTTPSALESILNARRSLTAETLSSN
ncbi:hypothetical protein G7021_00970 [Pseudomonas carnis]|jgi:hypothetical protein|uniref:Uncharacterized protein n=2 Tax=Pseudomonas TaxID=286 RepID=A0A125QH17_PSEFL|nr:MULTISPECIES: hypothetical protein [Pseudomonas]KWV83083.1 hypothetical protein PFL603g_01237 [Pseudomonas fluorescens]MBA1251224.1 hypothetical protein [Pseudomonas carnis]MBA1265993.1 hypothetical protein [Pseudomonas carnis]MBA1299308.1 hypothetical protein [Pseudomonas carnis]MBJ2199109.1 hypothetical protein [Pseudomonas carnis]